MQVVKEHVNRTLVGYVNKAVTILGRFNIGKAERAGTGGTNFSDATTFYYKN
jgi:hypothetical protein